MKCTNSWLSKPEFYLTEAMSCELDERVMVVVEFPGGFKVMLEGSESLVIEYA